jgi:hypothetical protein
MSNISRISAKTAIQHTFLATIAMITLGGTLQPAIATEALATKTFSRYSQDSWRTSVHLARLSNTQLVMQVDVQDKPVTRYANAVYSLYAYQNNQWVQVYTNTGARLIQNQRDRVVLAPEVIDWTKVSRESGIDIQATELKAVVTLRYDSESGRDQRVEFEQRRQFSAIAQTTSTQIVQSEEREVTTVATANTQIQSQSFSLAIAQATKQSKQVIARVSLKESHQRGFLAERFLGDFRYKLHHKKQQANFINGVKAGDRVVVRLFDKKGEFIGYSEFEVQAKNSLVTLVMGEADASFGVVRTIHGIDADFDNRIDARSSTYDYFSQVTKTQSWQSSQVTFFSSAQGINLSDFTIGDLPRPDTNCRLPNSLSQGQFSLVNQVFSAFDRNLARILTTVPGQLVQIVDVSTISIATYEVRQLLTEYASVRERQDVVYQVEQRDHDRVKPHKSKHHKQSKKSCNQGRGNGSEGCDPGKSRPHGGSNDGDD